MANTQFLGKNDYRGYLNYLGSQGDATAKTLIGHNGSLGLVNNQGQISSGGGVLNPNILNANTKYYQQFQKLNTPSPTNIGSIYAGGAGQVYAPKLDIAAVNAQARKSAAKAVNPYYTKQLNEFLTQQGVLKKQQQTQYATDIQNYQDTLKNTLEGNDLSRGRTIEDSATNQAQTNQQADQFQTDSGQQFEDARLTDAKQQAVAGTLGTGAGNRETSVALTQRNTQEARQEQQFQQTRDQTALLKGRNLEDLLKSDELAKTSESKNEKQTKFNLDNYLQGLHYQEQQTRNSLEKERLQQVGQETQNQAKLGFTKYLSTIKNPAQYAAAVSTYGGSFA